MVDPSTLFALQTVTGLPMGIGKDYAPITGATWDQVAAVQPFMTPVIWDMIQVQWNTGMRPGELCGMRCEDIDISDEDPEGVWLYIPRSHKTMRRRRRKVIPLGPRSVRILLTRISGRFHGIFRNRRKKPITTREYGSKVKRGFELSERAGANLTHWTAHQLRHGRATEIDSEYGVHGFEAITGDAANMRRIYVDQNLTLARKIARETG